MSFLKSISVLEGRDLLIAWLALAIAFTFALSGGLWAFTGFTGISINDLVVSFLIALLTVGLSFVLHELAHKFTAMHFGYWAEFRKSTQMLLIAIALAVVTGVVFAAPGATLINTAGREMTKKESGLISIAGPLMNLILAVPFFGMMVAGIFMSNGQIEVFSVAGILFLVGNIGFMVNAMLTFFNLLPVGPLDGRKILAWNPGVFVVMILIAVAVLFLALQPEIVAGFILR